MANDTKRDIVLSTVGWILVSPLLLVFIPVFAVLMRVPSVIEWIYDLVAGAHPWQGRKYK